MSFGPRQGEQVLTLKPIGMEQLPFTDTAL